MNKFITQTKLPIRGAEFESLPNFIKHSKTVNPKNPVLDYSGMPLDWLENNKYATSSKEQHCLIIGDTGSGKTRRLIVPTIRLIGKTKESMVISDPKGELYLKTARMLKENGYNVVVINMRDPSHGDRWNPFTMIEKLYKSDNRAEKDKSLLMLEEILEILKHSCHSEKDPYWEQSGIQYLKAIALTILNYGKEGDLSFQNIALAESEISSVLINGDKHHVLFRFLDSIDHSSDVYQNFLTITSLVGVETTLKCIVGTAHNLITQYTRQQAIRFLLSESDFSIESIGCEPTAVFMIIPDDSEALYPLATLFVDQVYSAMITLAYSKGGLTPNPVNFILDEFANFTRLPKMRSMLTASRSRGMRFFLVVQDIDQLEESYGKSGSSIIMSNCPIWIYMGCRNLTFLKMLKELSGFKTEKYTGNEYPLININDLQTLQMGETIVWNRRCNPKRCWLPDYSEVDFGNNGKTEDSDFPPENPINEAVYFDFFKMIESFYNSQFTQSSINDLAKRITEPISPEEFQCNDIDDSSDSTSTF